MKSKIFINQDPIQLQADIDNFVAGANQGKTIYNFSTFFDTNTGMPCYCCYVVVYNYLLP